MRHGEDLPCVKSAHLQPAGSRAKSQTVMRQSRLLPLIIATALFMENTDSTVIATSLPMIAQDLGEDPIALKLALTSYLVSLAIFIPISGWMADRFGARTGLPRRDRACSWPARSPARPRIPSTGFVLARFLQGMGGAMMVPVGRLVILRSVPRSELVQALATLTIPALVGPVLGPPLGGFITTYFDWRWIFFINIPIGILGHRPGDAVHPEHQGRATLRPSMSSASCCRASGSPSSCSASRPAGGISCPSRSRSAASSSAPSASCFMSCHARADALPGPQARPVEDPDLPRQRRSADRSSASASARSRSCCR